MTEGAKPYTMKVVRTVFNGGDEETGLVRPRLVATQLECGISQVLLYYLVVVLSTNLQQVNNLNGL